MAISDLISTSFLFSISIIIILIGGIFAYINYRFSEQNHKLNSMVGLVSTLAEEIRTLKIISTLDEERKEEKNEIHIFDTNMMSSGPDLNLIEVSDDEESESESDDDESVSSESDSNESVESESTDSEDEDEDLILEEADINVLEEMETDIKTDLNEDLNEDINNIKSIHLAEPINLEPAVTNSFDFENVNANENTNTNDLKTITISDIDMDLDTKQDFKKMPLNKLREIVVERNLVADASKLKKADLLKLLGEKE